MDTASCDNLVNEIAGNVFDTLRIPRIPLQCKEKYDGSASVRGCYQSSNNRIDFFTSQIKNKKKDFVTWLVWHEILHYYHELKQSESGFFYYIGNINNFDFHHSEDKETIKNIFNDLLDHLVEKQIAGLPATPRPDFVQRANALRTKLEDYRKGQTSFESIKEVISRNVIGIETLLRFGSLPFDAQTREYYRLLLKRIVARQIQLYSHLDEISFTYPNNNPAHICAAFNLVVPEYTLRFELTDIKDLAGSEDALSLWIKQKRLTRVWAFMVGNRVDGTV